MVIANADVYEKIQSQFKELISDRGFTSDHFVFPREDSIVFPTNSVMVDHSVDPTLSFTVDTLGFSTEDICPSQSPAWINYKTNLLNTTFASRAPDDFNARSGSGTGSTSTGNNANTFGTSNDASGNNSIAAGSGTTASGDSSSAGGKTEDSGVITAQGTSSSSGGFSTGADSQIIASGTGDSAGGVAKSGGKILTSDDSSYGFGLAENDGEIRSDGKGSYGSGWADTGCIRAMGDATQVFGRSDGFDSDIFATNTAAIADGYARNGGKIEASGEASRAGGEAADDAELRAISLASSVSGYTADIGSKIEACGTGDKAIGAATTGGQIISTSEASIAHGCAENSGIIRAGGMGGLGKGSLAFGLSDGTDSLLSAEAEASLVSGKALNNGTIQATGVGSQALGSASGLDGDIIASGIGSIALGSASNSGSIRSDGTSGSIAGGNADGGLVNAAGTGSIALGNGNGGAICAFGSGAFAHGYCEMNERTEADAEGSFASGRHVQTNNVEGVHIIGRYGIAKASSTGSGGIGLPNPGTITGDYSFQIAGGVDENVTDGIAVILGTETASNTNPTGGGIADFWHTSGADYAEYFEWDDGNTADEDRCGYFVELANEKIVKASNADNVIGVTTAKIGGTSGCIGDSAQLRWHDANLKDNMGRTQYTYSYKQPLSYVLKRNKVTFTTEINDILDGTDDETMKTNLHALSFSTEIKDQIDNVTPIRIAKLNPAFDPELTYIPRSARKEWISVGLLGKVYVYDDGTCVVGQKCTSSATGVATPGSKWFVLKRTDTNIIQILFK